MNKKFLSVLLCGAIMSGSTGMFTSCKNYDSDIASLDERVTAVEKSVSELKAQISGGAVITDVQSTANGVTVTLSNGKTFELTNGKDGANGSNGQDGQNGQNGQPGSVVTIGDNGNWFIDGVDTGKPSQGEKGDKGDQGDPGTPGTPGGNGNKGDKGDTIYYYPGTEGEESGFWVKVTRDGATGNETKEVTTDSWMPTGTVTAVWDTEEGYLILNNVEGSEEAIRIQLFSTLQSLAFVPQVIDTKLGMGVIDFYTITKDNAFVASNTALATYRLNPTNAKVSDIEWSFIDRTVATRVAGDNYTLLAIDGEPEVLAGSVNFNVIAEDDLSDLKADQEAIVALRAVDTDDAEIVSDYAAVKVTELTDFAIINKEKLKYDEDNNVDYTESLPVVELSTTLPAIGATADAYFKYDESKDLHDVVETWAEEISKVLTDASVRFTPVYAFEKVDKYLGTDGATDQQQFVTLDEETGIVTVNKEWLAQGTAAVGRTPVFKVTSLVNNTAIASAYIKLEITKEAVSQEEKEDFEKTWNVNQGVAIEYSDIDPTLGFTEKYSWATFNAEILDVLGITPDEFMNRYDIANYTIVPNNGTVTGVTITSNVVDGTTETEIANIHIKNTAAFGAKTFTLTYPAKNNYQDPNIVITIAYTIEHDDSHMPALNPDYLLAGTANTVQVKGREVNDTWKLNAAMKEFCKDYLNNYDVTAGNHTDLYFRFKDNQPVTGVAITGSNWSDQEIALTTPLTQNEDARTYEVEMVAKCVNGELCTKAFIVRFVRPFNATIDATVLKTLTATADTEDIAKLVVIRDTDNRVVYENGALTTLGTQTYKLNASTLTFAYSIDYTNDSEASFGGGLTIDATNGMLTWLNQGGDLQTDKKATSVAVITIPDLADIKATGTITVLSTANSKE